LWLAAALALLAWACGGTAPAAPTTREPVPPPAPAPASQPPTVHIGYITRFSGSVELLGNVVDQAEGLLCGSQYCLGAVAAGAACDPRVSLSCTCLAGLEAQVLKTAASGTCTVTFTVKNSQGTTGTSSVTFDVAR
jgi:hypothetical protein